MSQHEETNPTPTNPPATSPIMVDHLVPRRLQVGAAIGWRVLVLAGCAWVLLQVLALGSSVIIPIGVALLLTSLLAPTCEFLVTRLHFPRYVAAALTVVCVLAVMIGLTTLAGNSMINGWSDVGTNFFNGLDKMQDLLNDGPLGLGGEQTSNALASAREWAQSNSGLLTSGVMQAGTAAAAVVGGSLLALVSTLFFLADGKNIWRWWAFLLPESNRQHVHEALRRGWLALGAYIRTQIVVAAIDAIGIAAGAWVLGLPFVLPIVIIVFFASLIPIVGAVLSGGLVVVLALFTGGPITALIMLAIVLGVQQLEGQLLQPLLVGRAVNLHPWAVIIGVALGGYLMGITGALFAVPLMALVNTTVRYLTGSDPFPSLGTSPLEPPQRGLSEPPPEVQEQLQKAPWWKRFTRPLKKLKGNTPTSSKEDEKLIASDP